MPAIERHLRVQRSARYVLLGAAGTRTRELWIACHGYGQLAGSFAKALEPLEHPDRLIAVPEALNRFYLDDPNKRHGPDSPVGATWMTREDREREIVDYVDYLDAVVADLRADIGAAAAGMPVSALGFSQGVATACRWAILGRTPLRRLVLWGANLPADLPTGRAGALFRGAEVTMVVGRKDFFVSPSGLERDVAALESRGVPVRLLRFDGGHSLNSDLLRRIAAEGQ